MLPRFLKPELFQGNLNKKKYFEGWYFKNVSADMEHVWSFIPGISLNQDDPHAFIQSIDGITGETDYTSYPLRQFRWRKDSLLLQVGDSVFTGHSMIISLKHNGNSITGNLRYRNIVRYPNSLLSPGIMGWYSFVPYMECRHGIVSVIHDISGQLKINGTEIDFSGGRGYIEKDWGKSFPEAWIWIQSNNFSNHTASFSFSIAKIPWLGKYFMGFISFLHLDGKFYLFSTYNNSVVDQVVHDDNELHITMRNRKYRMEIAVKKNRFGELRAPAEGSMRRKIKESIDSTVSLRLLDKNGRQIFADTGKRAGLEVTEEIFNYLR